METKQELAATIGSTCFFPFPNKTTQTTACVLQGGCQRASGQGAINRLLLRVPACKEVQCIFCWFWTASNWTTAMSKSGPLIPQVFQLKVWEHALCTLNKEWKCLQASNISSGDLTLTVLRDQSAIPATCRQHYAKTYLLRCYDIKSCHIGNKDWFRRNNAKRYEET